MTMTRSSRPHLTRIKFAAGWMLQRHVTRTQRTVVVHEQHVPSPDFRRQHGASIRRPAGAGNTTLVLRGRARTKRRAQPGTDSGDGRPTRSAILTRSATETAPIFSIARQDQPAFRTAGGFQVPCRIDGAFSFGQYRRSIRTNLPFGAGRAFLPRRLGVISAASPRRSAPCNRPTSLPRSA